MVDFFFFFSAFTPQINGSIARAPFSRALGLVVWLTPRFNWTITIEVIVSTHKFEYCT